MENLNPHYQIQGFDQQAKDIADLARRNIHITNITVSPHDTLYIMVKFQWRDPRNNTPRWAETFIEASKYYTGGQFNTTTNLFEDIKTTVAMVRQDIEEQYNG